MAYRCYRPIPVSYCQCLAVVQLLCLVAPSILFRVSRMCPFADRRFEVVEGNALWFEVFGLGKVGKGPLRSNL